MIPVLYEAFEHNFTNNGICRLSDCISCEVTEERNGKYELVMEYPMTGVRFDEIKEGRLIYVTHDENGDPQPFEIYRKSAPISGVVTFNARHISYRLSKVILKPFSVGSLALALDKIKNETFNENPFTFWTDKSTVAKFSVPYPSSIRSILGGTVGSILDVYGGEYEFDKFLVRLWNHRGADNGVTVRYGKNLTDLTQTLDTGSLYNAIVPYWKDTAGNCVYGNPVTAQGGVKNRTKWNEEHGIIMTDENNAEFEFDAYSEDVIAMDFSEEFKEEAPTPRQLEDKAKAYLASNTPWIANENIKFDFVALWQTDEYADIASLERVKLCDTVTVEYTALGVSAKAKVVKVVWDALEDRYKSVEVGDARTSFGEAISREIQKAVEDRPTVTDMDIAIEAATSLITGGMGGHVVFAYDADGKPTEIYVMDTEDVNTAVHVLRINVNGIGFSNNGVNGTYRTAWTLDGHFVADFITTGTLSANLIKAGVLSSRDGKSYWDLDDSKFRFYDQSFDSYIEMDNGYISFGHAGEHFATIKRWISRSSETEGRDIAGFGNDETDTVLWIAPDYATLQGGTGESENQHARLALHNDSIYKYATLEADRETDDTFLRIDKTNQYINLRNQDVRLYMNQSGSNQYGIFRASDNTYIRVDEHNGYINLTCGDAWIELDDNSTRERAIMKATTDDYIVIDSKNGLAYLQMGSGMFIRINKNDGFIDLHAGNDEWIRVDASEGKTWIAGRDILFNGMAGYTGWVNNMYFKNGLLVQVN